MISGQGMCGVSVVSFGKYLMELYHVPPRYDLWARYQINFD